MLLLLTMEIKVCVCVFFVTSLFSMAAFQFVKQEVWLHHENNPEHLYGEGEWKHCGIVLPSA